VWSGLSTKREQGDEKEGAGDKPDDKKAPAKSS